MTTSRKDDDAGRRATDETLRDERARSDDRHPAQSQTVAAESDEIISRARERARRVLQLARDMADHHLRIIGASTEMWETVREERRLEDVALASEAAAADARRIDELERGRAAAAHLLADERSATDDRLRAERHEEDLRVDARAQLLAAVAHDMRTLLSTVVVNSSVILLAPDLTTATTAAAGIHRASTEMAHLLDNLLDVSTFDAGTLSLVRTDVDLVRLAREAALIHGELAKARHIELAVKPDADALSMKVDGRRITRLLVNLISNALKYTPVGGRIEVLVTSGAGTCELAVRDTGIGIAADQLEAIFGRYHRVDGERQRAAGTGLGLYLCRRIAEAHGGRIWAESELGVGSTFRVQLPRP